MKVYVVVELGSEYDDEYYSQPECGGGLPVKAFRQKANAEAHMKELEAAKRKGGVDERDWGGYIPPAFYEVRETELADEDVATYADAQRLKAEAKEAAKNASRAAFETGAKAIFDQFPGLESFGFTAYTPYFNDGDTCTFGVNAEEPWLNGEHSKSLDPGYKYEYKNGRYVKVETGNRNPLLDAVKPISEFVYSFDEDDIEAMFGDHVKVAVTRSPRWSATGVKVETDAYHHD